MKTQIGSNLTYLGFSLVMASFIMFFIWIMQFALWSDYENEEEDEKAIGGT